MFAAYAVLGFRIARASTFSVSPARSRGNHYDCSSNRVPSYRRRDRTASDYGLTLPFISYGRSNMVLSMLMTGILVNIGSTREKIHGGRATDPSFAIGRA